MQHWQLTLKGTRQGIGLRPAVRHLAKKHELTGHVKNSGLGVSISIYGKTQHLDHFVIALTSWLENIVTTTDENSSGINITAKKIVLNRPKQFSIAPSSQHLSPSNYPTALMAIQTDHAICNLCQAEYNDPNNRRYQYPFISCIQCGPRFSILKNPPFDRDNTSFAKLPPCESCQVEYQNPADRRCHAQTISCPDCGPTLWLYDAHTQSTQQTDPIKTAGALLKQSQIITLKTPAGFQLVAAANQQQAISALRHAKRRPQKPFAVMFDSLNAIAEHCHISPSAKQALTSPSRPIVLLPLKANPLQAALPKIHYADLAPGLRQLGCFLPTTALHFSLLAATGSPIIVTSGNLRGDFLYRQDSKALEALTPYCQYYLFNNLDIVHPIDDSVVQIIEPDIQILRRARGYVPQPIPLTLHKPEQRIIGLGGGEKTSFAIATHQQVYLSQDFGDLQNPHNFSAYQRHLNYAQGFMPSDHRGTDTDTDQYIFQEIDDSQKPVSITLATDQHPDYMTTQYARQYLTRHTPELFKNTLKENPHAQPDTQNFQSNHVTQQHHESHFWAVLSERGITEKALGIIWDGAGLGCDHQVWGGEFFTYIDDHIQHVGQLLPFPLLGGDLAAKFPIRNAISLVLTGAQSGYLLQDTTDYAWWLDRWQDRRTPFCIKQFSLLREQVTRLNRVRPDALNQATHPGTRQRGSMTSSIGRLFDAVSALLCLCHENTYVGEAALKLMHCALAHLDEGHKTLIEKHDHTAQHYPFEITIDADDNLTLDWRPALAALIQDLSQGVASPLIACRFHWSLAQAAAQASERLAKLYGCQHVLCAGGAWQNTLLIQSTKYFLTDNLTNNLIDHLTNNAQRTTPQTHTPSLEYYVARRLPPNDASLALGQILGAALQKSHTNAQ